MIETLLDRLDKVRSRGANQWMACCPAHDDSDPSLAVKVLQDGRILVRCFAGCEAMDIVHAVGLRLSDLFPRTLGEFKGWEQLQREARYREAKKKDDRLFRERAVLEIADAARARGERLSTEDLKREEEAFMRIRNANNNQRTA